MLTLGRIPLFVDSDCVLPFEELIDYHALMPWCDATKIEDIGDRLIEFHNALTPEAFIKNQENCRALWDEWLSPEAYPQKLVEFIVQKNL